jgi:hypothetical protein
MRVLAVTTNASLVVALGSMMRDWEVVTVREVERATDEGVGSAVALIDLGETDAGMDAAGRLSKLGILIPCVVIGDKPADDVRATVLVRPFSLEDLGNAVREAATRPARPAPAAEPMIPTPAGNGHAVEASAPAVQEIESPEPLPRHRGLVAVPQTEPAPEPEEPWVAEAAEDVEVEEVSDLPEPSQAFSAPEAAAEPAWQPEPEPQPQPEPAAWVEPVEQESVRPVFHEPIARETAEPGRWRLRKRGARPAAVVPESAEAPLVHRLRVAAAHARELEELVAQLPFLADLHAMAEGLVSEVDRQFVCAIASVSVLRDRGYEVVAHRGLSKVEAGMVIPENQSLFNDVIKTREGVLIQPVDLAQGLVAGIGGARTEAMMVAPALVNDECVAIVVIGGDKFEELDLDRLAELTAEAAPGIAVAQLLEQLRAF